MKAVFTILLLLIISVSNVFAYTTNLEEAWEEIKQIEKGESYKNIIDNFISKNSDNKEFLIKIGWNLEKLGNSKLDFSEDFYVVINYIKLNINTALVNINELEKLEEEKKEEEEQVEESEEEQVVDEEEEEEEESEQEEEEESEQEEEEEYTQEEVEEIVYPWFSTEYDDNDKVILAGETYEVYEAKIASMYEPVKLWKVKFYLNGVWLDEFKSILNTAYFYVEWRLVDTSIVSNVDIINSSSASISFSISENIIIPEESTKIRLAIKTNNIWYQKVWKSIENIRVTWMSFKDSIWQNSSHELNNFSVSDNSEYFSVVTWVLKLIEEKELNNWEFAEFTFLADTWKNSNPQGFEPSIKIDEIDVSVSWEVGSYVYEIANADDTSDRVTWTLVWNKVKFDLSTMSIANKTLSSGGEESFRVYVSWTWILSISLPKDGVTYVIE